MITKVLSFAPQQGEVCHFPLWFEKKSAREGRSTSLQAGVSGGGEEERERGRKPGTGG